MHTAQAWTNAPCRTRVLSRRLPPPCTAATGTTRSRLPDKRSDPVSPGCDVTSRSAVGGVRDPPANDWYHGAAESPRLGPPPLAVRNLHDTRLEQTNPVATAGGRTS